MAFTNSPLVTFTRLSPNYTPNRNHDIDTVSIHCVVGQCTVQSLGALFANPARQASSNYGIGYEGSIGLFCEEKNRSWCSSSPANDHRAITIEVASDTKHPYAVTQKAYDSLLRLLADICKRNNIKQLLWQADKSLVGQTDKQNMTPHRWFASTACPGDYLYSRYGEIASEVNKRLGISVKQIKEDDVVRIVGNTYTNGTAIPTSIKSRTHVVAQIKGDRALLGYPDGIRSWVNLNSLALVESTHTQPVVPVEATPIAPPALTEPTVTDRAIAKGIIAVTDNLNQSASKRDVVEMLDRLGLLG